MLLSLLLSALACTPLPTCTAALVAAGTPCASPTPVLAATFDPNGLIDGHTLYVREPGGAYQAIGDVPCFLDDSGARHCNLFEMGIPVQRFCSNCAAGMTYEFAAKAYSDKVTPRSYSIDFSAAVSVCASPLCTKPGPCQ
jgi:hypothetical protein